MIQKCLFSYSGKNIKNKVYKQYENIQISILCVCVCVTECPMFHCFSSRWHISGTPTRRPFCIFHTYTYSSVHSVKSHDCSYIGWSPDTWLFSLGLVWQVVAEEAALSQPSTLHKLLRKLICKICQEVHPSLLHSSACLIKHVSIHCNTATGHRWVPERTVYCRTFWSVLSTPHFMTL